MSDSLRLPLPRCLRSFALTCLLPAGALAVLGTGCGTLASGASYSGTRYPPVVTAAQVVESGHLPDGHEVIGEVRASCSDAEGDVEWYDVLLSDILCSEGKLAGSMREKVAEVGGTTLVGRQCNQDKNTETRTKKKDGKEREVTVTTTHIECEGEVSRPKPSPVTDTQVAANEPEPPKEDKPVDKSDDDDESSAPWRIRVRVTRAKDTARREPREAEAVEAVESAPEGTERIADIVARCEQGCSKSAVHNGVREAGARAGATAVVKIACVEEGEGWTCTGTAVAPPASP